MKFMITWQMKPGRLHEALELFASLPTEPGQPEAPGIHLIGQIGRAHV